MTANDTRGVNWHALAKRYHEIQAGMLHGSSYMPGQEKSELYGADFDAEAMRRAVESFRPVDGSSRLISAASADDMVQRAVATWKFNASQHERVAEDYKARWLKAERANKAEAYQEFADNLRQTAHSAKGKLRHEERLAIADWLDRIAERERQRSESVAATSGGAA
jgi:hypothetical protein